MLQQDAVAAGSEADILQQQQQQQACRSWGVTDAAGVVQPQMGGQTIAAAAAAAAAVARCRPVMVAMPDGGDVNFYELRPVKLMDLLANEY
jgi:hypothetical protein